MEEPVEIDAISTWTNGRCNVTILPEEMNDIIKRFILLVNDGKETNLSSFMHNFVIDKIRNEYEGQCIKNGIVLKSSARDEFIRVKKEVAFSPAEHMSGSMLYKVNYEIKVCDPKIGYVLYGEVVDYNNEIGIMMRFLPYCPDVDKVENENYYSSIDNQFRKNPIMILAPHQVQNAGDSAIHLEDLNKNDIVSVEVLGRKYDISGKRICVIGKILKLVEKYTEEPPCEETL
jgi:hypothetical protein